MDYVLPTPGIVLYIWPGRWGLPSFDPLCLAAVLYLQLAIPGKFALKECSNPDASPTGQLPFLVHEQYVAASYASIVKYVSGLRNADHTTYENAYLDIHLTPCEKSQKNAWYAHAEKHLGNLVFYSLYSNHENWTKMTNPTLASMFAIPQKYYLPQRIRDAYFPRLSAAGLWKEHVEGNPTQTQFPRDVKSVEKERLTTNATLSQAFNKEMLLDKARPELEIYKELLDNKIFIFQNQPSSLDLLIAAHVLVLLEPPYPDFILKNLILDSYPSLESHSRLIYSTAFEVGKPTLTATPSSSSVWALLPSWPINHHAREPQSEEDVYYTRMRWGFFGLVLGSVVAYLTVVGSRYKIVFRSPDEFNGPEIQDEGTEEEEV